MPKALRLLEIENGRYPLVKWLSDRLPRVLTPIEHPKALFALGLLGLAQH